MLGYPRKSDPANSILLDHHLWSRGESEKEIKRHVDVQC